MSETAKKKISPTVTVTCVEAEVEAEATPAHLDVEKLGRIRPAVFPSALAEVAFCFSVIQSALMSVCACPNFPMPLCMGIVSISYNLAFKSLILSRS